MSIEVGFFILAVTILFGTAITILISTLRTGSPPTPSGPALRQEIIKVTANAGAGEGVIYELGSGWGGLARALARAQPDRSGVGLESSPVPWAVSAVANRFFGPPNLQTRLADIGRVDLADAAVVVCYLSGETLTRLARRLETRLPPGCAVVSAMFAWPGLEAIASTHAGDLYRSPVYLYRTGGGPAGQ